MPHHEAAEDTAEENAFRLLLKSEFAAGMFSLVPSEAVVEIAGYAGFQFMVFDTEHGTYDLAMIERLVRVAGAVGMASLVRVSHPPDPHFVTRVLDLGVDGLMFARISSRQEAEAVVASCRLAPLGTRGPFPGLRAGHYFRMPGEEYRRRSNNVATVVLIETKEGLEDIEAIVSVDGLDAVAVGPVDLSIALGVPRDGPEVAAALARVNALARAGGKAVMASAKDFEELESHLSREDGPRVFWYATDTYQISNHFHALMEKSRDLVSKYVGTEDR
jgi:4-hydroxy-2-oxoheptanedioate aldolase